MIIPSNYNTLILAFNIQGCLTLSCTFDSILNVGDIKSKVNTFPSLLNQGNNKAVTFFNSVLIKTLNSFISTFGLSLDVDIINLSSYNITFTNIGLFSIALQSLSITIIIIPDPSLIPGVTINTFLLSS